MAARSQTLSVLPFSQSNYKHRAPCNFLFFHFRQPQSQYVPMWEHPLRVTLSLPTANPERASSMDKVPKWSARAIKSFAMVELEARKLKYLNTGTEALLMGILVEGASIAAKFLRENGITLFKVREETVNLVGKSDMYFSAQSILHRMNKA